MSIYSKVKTILTSDTTLQTLLSATVNNKKVFFHYPKGSTIKDNLPCITYYFMETPKEFKDPQSSIDGILYVDIWSEGNLNNIYDRVIYLLMDAGFFTDLSQSIDIFENDTQIYHKHIAINVIGG